MPAIVELVSRGTGVLVMVGGKRACRIKECVLPESNRQSSGVENFVSLIRSQNAMEYGIFSVAAGEGDEGSVLKISLKCISLEGAESV